MAARRQPEPEAEPDLPALNLQEAMMEMADEDTELDKIFKLFLDERNIAHNTELSRQEITAFSVLATMTSRHKLPVLQEFMARNMLYRVSKGRGGRKEWVKILNRHMGEDQSQMQNPGMAGRWFRRRPRQ